MAMMKTPQEINRQIAEMMGIKPVFDPASDTWHLTGYGQNYGKGKGISEDHAWKVCCPNYWDDLNAIQGVFLQYRHHQLPEDEKAQFTTWICEFCLPDAIFRPASEWCKVFMQHMGLWEP